MPSCLHAEEVAAVVARVDGDAVPEALALGSHVPQRHAHAAPRDDGVLHLPHLEIWGCRLRA